jgi:hypothetical protein
MDLCSVLLFVVSFCMYSYTVYCVRLELHYILSFVRTVVAVGWSQDLGRLLREGALSVCIWMNHVLVREKNTYVTGSHSVDIRVHWPSKNLYQL